MEEPPVSLISCGREVVDGAKVVYEVEVKVEVDEVGVVDKVEVDEVEVDEVEVVDGAVE